MCVVPGDNTHARYVNHQAALSTGPLHHCPNSVGLPHAGTCHNGPSLIVRILGRGRHSNPHLSSPSRTRDSCCKQVACMLQSSHAGHTHAGRRVKFVWAADDGVVASWPALSILLGQATTHAKRQHKPQPNKLADRAASYGSNLLKKPRRPPSIRPGQQPMRIASTATLCCCCCCCNELKDNHTTQRAPENPRSVSQVCGSACGTLQEARGHRDCNSSMQARTALSYVALGLSQGPHTPYRRSHLQSC
jgi:hypothetical protein